MDVASVGSASASSISTRHSNAAIPIQAPASCPFSGVAIDSAMWESFQASLASNNNNHHPHHHRRREEESSKQLPTLSRRSTFTARENPRKAMGSRSRSTNLVLNTDDDAKARHRQQIRSQAQELVFKADSILKKVKEQRNGDVDERIIGGDYEDHVPSAPLIAMGLVSKPSKSIRVHVMNQTTKRHKDLVLTRSQEEKTLFSAIYNNPSVKEANVRKWGGKIAQDVKKGVAVIQIQIQVGARKDDKLLSVEELKEITTQHLFDRVAAESSQQIDAVVQFCLLCVPKDNDETKSEAQHEVTDSSEALPKDTNQSSTEHGNNEKAIPPVAVTATTIMAPTMSAVANPSTKNPMNSIRVRVINQTTKRQKDLLLNHGSTQGETLFSTIYNHPTVKEAHIRKWGTPYTQNVKNGLAEIKVEILVGDTREDNDHDDNKLLSVDELKDITIHSLFERVAAAAESTQQADPLVQFCLMCVSKDNDSHSEPEKDSKDAEVIQENKINNNIKNAAPVVGNTGESKLPVPGKAPKTISPTTSSSIPAADRQNKSIRVRIINQTTKRQKDLLFNHASTQGETLFSAIYNNPTVKEAHIRKWGTPYTLNVKKGLAEIKVQILVGDTREDSDDKLLSVDELKDITIQSLFERVAAAAESTQQADPLVQFCLTCVPKDNDSNSAPEKYSKDSEVKLDSINSTASAEVGSAEESNSVATKALNTMSPTVSAIPAADKPIDSIRVRVINQTTKRQKDLLLNQANTQGETLFTAIYNNPTVKEAHIRKWGTPYTQNVKKGLAEIKVQIQVGNEREENDNKLLSVDDLKDLTIQSFFGRVAAAAESTQQTDPLVQFCLVCVPKDDSKFVEDAAVAPKDDGRFTADKSNVEEPVLSEAITVPKSVPPIMSDRPAMATTIRVRVVNQTTKRQKDLILSLSENETLYDAIYDSPTVKEAHIHKWGPKIAQDVKKGVAEIKIQIQVGDKRGEDNDKLLSVDNLKEFTTQKLVERVAAESSGEMDSLVQCCLMCVPKDVKPATQDSVETEASNSVAISLQNRRVTAESAPPIAAVTEPRQNEPSPATRPVQVQFLAIERETSTERMADSCDQHSEPVMAATRQHALTIASSSSDLALTSSQPNSVLSDQEKKIAAKAEKQPAVRISSCKSDGSSLSSTLNDPPWGIRRTNSIDPETLPPTTRIARQEAVRTGSEVTSTSLQANPDESTKRPLAYGHTMSIGTSSHSYFDSTLSEGLGANSLSMMDIDDQQSQVTMSIHGEDTNQQPQYPLAPINSNDKAKSTLGVRIINQVTKRSKDLVVDINDSDTIFDTVYNHEAVKAAHVRKWGGPIAKAVKNGTSEIKFSVWDDNTGKPWRVFAIDELKTTTTRQLSELVSESSYLVKIYLQCCNMNSSGSLSINSNKTATQATTPTKRLLPKVKPTPVRQASLRLQKHGRPQFSITESSEFVAEQPSSNRPKAPATLKMKIPSRSSHMKLASFMGRHDSCPTDMTHLKKGSHESLIAATRNRIEKQQSSLLAGLDERLQVSHVKSQIPSSMSVGNLQNAVWEPRKARALPSPRKVRAPNRPRNLNRATSLDGSPCPSRQLEIMPAPPVLKRLQSETSMPNNNGAEDDQKREKLKQFLRLLRAKKGPEFQSQRTLKDTTSQEKDAPSQKPLADKATREDEAPVTSIAKAGNQQVAVPTVVQTNEKLGGLSKRVSSLSFQGRRPSLTVGAPNAVFTAINRNAVEKDRINRFLRLDISHQSMSSCLSINSSNKEISRTSDKASKESDRITRFLAVQSEGAQAQQGTGKDSVGGGGSRTSRISGRKRLARRPSMVGQTDIPPIKEISVIPNEDEAVPAPVQNTGVSLSADLVKEIFPYHVVLDADFRITQVGNNFEMLIQESCVVGRIVNDILTVTSPIPMPGNWNWSVLDKMKDKQFFLETVLSPAMEEQVRLKGTLVEVSKSPKQVMFVLFPNVKNLAELEEANLSMADLPLHSCQREAVLLGEHNKSEVKLTNHLDKLHRDLIDSMEQQIKDRTEELAEANRDLERANAQLAIQSARQLEHFACMSHEIRTPLNCIVGMSSLLLDDADEMDPMHSDSIQMINTSGDLLKAVVDDVLDYAKLESGSFEVDIKDINLQHTLSSVAHSISQKIQDKNVRLRKHYSPLLPETFTTDSRRLQQVLFNLLGNSGKFSKKNSVIDFTVSVVPVASTGVNPDDTCNGEVVRFSVKDYGKGIEEKDFKTIFDPFSQASKETQTLYGGTGLGLSITSKLVKRLGGTISVQSDYGKFAEFTVDLPFKGKPVNVAKLRKRLRNTTIVIVEPKQHYDYSFTTYKIKEEPVPLQSAENEAFDLNVIRCENLEQAHKKLRLANLVTPDKHFAVLVQEDLYEFGTIERLEEILCKLNYTLMTFGPKYAVEMTKDRHFKSLDGVFPSALLTAIAEHIERRKTEKMFSNRRLSILKSPQSSTPQSARNLFYGISDDDKYGKLFAPFTESRRHSAPGIPALAKGLFAASTTTIDVVPSLVVNDKVVSAAATGAQGGLFASINDNPASQGGLFADKDECSPQGGLSTGENSRQQSLIPTTSNLSSTISTRQPTASGQNLNVLYAEDNTVNQKVLARVLKRVGITKLTLVDNGKKAVDVCETQKFDCIFMDVQMPVMGGLDATKLIVERDPDAKVIFCTAHALEEFKAQADAVGGSGFLSKPFRLDDIKKLLADFKFASPRAGESIINHAPPQGAVNNQSCPQGDLAGSNGAIIEATSAQQPRASPGLTVVNTSKPAPSSQGGLFAGLPTPQGGLFAGINGVVSATAATGATPDQLPLSAVSAATGAGVKHLPPQGGLFAGIQSNPCPHCGQCAGINSNPSPPFAGIKGNPSPQGGLFAADNFGAASSTALGTKPGQKPQISVVAAAKLNPSGTVTPAATTSKPAAPEQNLKFLYAEDNLVNQKVLSRVLKRVGITNLTIVDNGKEAVDVCETEKFDCIFMDMQMPVMDGLEATRLIVERDPSAKVIFVSAQPLEEFKAKADAVGGSGFIAKPFGIADIKKVLEEFKGASEGASKNSNPAAKVGAPKTSTADQAGLPSAINGASTRAMGPMVGQQPVTSAPAPTVVGSKKPTPLVHGGLFAGLPAPQGGLFAGINGNGSAPQRSTAGQQPVTAAPTATSQGGLFAGLTNNPSPAPSPAPQGGLFAGLAPTQGGLFSGINGTAGNSGTGQTSPGQQPMPAAPAPAPTGANSKPTPAPQGGLFAAVPAPQGGLFAGINSTGASTTVSGTTPGQQQPVPAAPAPTAGSSMAAPTPQGGLFAGLPAAPQGGLFAGITSTGACTTVSGTTPGQQQPLPAAPAPTASSSITAPTPKGGLFAGLPAAPQGGLFAGINSTGASTTVSGTTPGQQQAPPAAAAPTAGSSIAGPAPQGGLFAGLPAAPQGGLFAGFNGNGSSSTIATVTTVSQQSMAPAGAAKSEPPTPRGSKSRVVPPQRNFKVLYAEDNVVNQKVLQKVLARVGVTDLTIVDNGKKAVDLCETEKFDCVFMDIQMPVMGGMEATRLIVDRKPNAKVIFVTAHALDEFKAQAVAAGATGFLSKPFRLDDIRNLLSEFFGF
ncbi:Hybrid signal transduction histidine kinase J [Seminavis robusta]|uniref:guanylate cyclase n=1 Tax=Seminavis robusta TaxID=568900 RepID=A0A9N8HB38_9STRA|nr:Hybrid signal transduction histidine kinase J [Seminavis robusta]|eukprot:Sro346_g122750.1 Hybrid signal transduction histidine kinase J (3572) ;mRNA; r:47243-58563